jgi:hypothetical protein
MEAFWGYVVGGLIGSIICVACDRLWRLYENKVRVEVTIVSVSGFNDADLNISIVNKGSVPLPPSSLVLWIETEKDKAWSERGFEPHPNTLGPGWMPLQQKAFVKNLTRNRNLNPELKSIHDEYVSPYKVELILKMNESAKALWRSEEMGQSVLAHLRAAYEQGKFPEGLTNTRHIKYETWGELWRRMRRKRGD